MGIQGGAEGRGTKQREEQGPPGRGRRDRDEEARMETTHEASQVALTGFKHHGARDIPT